MTYSKKHRWMKLGTGRFSDRACVDCGLTARVVRESIRKTPPKNPYPVFTYQRGDDVFGIVKGKLPQCHLPDTGGQLFTLDGYVFKVFPPGREIKPISTEKIGAAKSKRSETKT